MNTESSAHGDSTVEHCDVAIVGYGPTGLVAASMLGRADELLVRTRPHRLPAAGAARR
ncbi:3-(3-hydroxyphenyl)propionate hydroxylase [Burkholderia lata]|uniref:hypothetical protein n=1 Tax=Burkholderia lata (strain ATCC 17760 / DSM 23089 / LMG 22485 / NCIMB 9086 / R18194 / 383) TaxID=482957 RepID=UPI00145458FB|nr:hypothetical protein [Burkholderia lata]VWC98455.1 3-(3-hydroxyphenyl)propionate hydroxylase [Burkholderia lata]